MSWLGMVRVICLVFRVGEQGNFFWGGSEYFHSYINAGEASGDAEKDISDCQCKFAPLQQLYGFVGESGESGEPAADAGDEKEPVWVGEISF